MKKANTTEASFGINTLLLVCAVWAGVVLYAFFTSRLPGKLYQLLTGH